MRSLIRWEPFTTMRKWDPFDELRTMQREMDRLFSRFLGSEGTVETGQPALWIPSIESYTKEGKLVIKAELPGVDSRDLDVSITDRELVIKGERKAERDEKAKEFAYREISYGSFERRFLLPEGVKAEELKASFADGILEITVPVPEVPKSRKVEIKTEEPKKLEPGISAKKAA